jgi:hypothetical protein
VNGYHDGTEAATAYALIVLLAVATVIVGAVMIAWFVT